MKYTAFCGGKERRLCSTF